MGLSSSKKTTTSASTQTSSPLAAYSPYINQALGSAQTVFQNNQPNLQAASSLASQGATQLAQNGFGASPYVQNAQANATAIGNGAFYGTNPGAQTYQSLMTAQNPALASLSGLVGSATANPALGTLSTLAQGSTSPGDYSSFNGNNPALGAYARLLNGGNNSALSGLAAYGYGTGSLGAGDGTLGSFAASGTNGQSNYADAYDRSVLNGDYLNNNPYLDKITKQATDAATLAQNQRFGLGGLGADNSSAYSAALGSAVANANDQTRYTAYNAERQLQDAASGRISSNFNADQDRALTSANDLSAGSRADAAFRLGALNDLSGAQNQQTQNALAAASGFGSTYANGQNLAFQAQQARDSAFQNDRASQLAAAQGLGSLYQQGQAGSLAAAQGLGSLYQQQNAGQLSAATAADSSQQSQIQQMLSALGLTGNLEQAGYAGVDPTLNALSASASLPYAGTNAYANLINSLTGKYGTQTGNSTTVDKSSPSLVSSLGQALQLGSLFGGGLTSAFGGGISNAVGSFANSAPSVLSAGLNPLTFNPVKIGGL